MSEEMMTLEEFMRRIKNGERLRPKRWDGAGLFDDGYVVRSGAMFHEITPRTVGISVSPWQIGAREHYAKWGADWYAI